MLILFFLSSGLFLGWSLGANDASNVFGSAVSTKMVRFKTAALISSIFVILGAVLSGNGTSHTLGQLGSVNMIAGAFIVALSGGFTMFLMTRLGIPVSGSQTIVGAIIGWNFFSGTLTDWDTLLKIFSSWVAGPILAAIIAYILYKLMLTIAQRINIHLLRLDAYTRLGLILASAFGAYALGANNIANVMGVFIPAAPFKTITLWGDLQFSSTQQLFFLGGIAITIGIFTYSKRVIKTVGSDILHLTPQAALVVVLSEALVLFLFASNDLHAWLVNNNLPALPLVPISSSQAVIGSVLGIGLVHGGRNIRFKVLGKIAMGWLTTPLIAIVMTFLALFFLQNVFNQQVYYPVRYAFTEEVKYKLAVEDISVSVLDSEYDNARKLLQAMKVNQITSQESRNKILFYSEVYPLKISTLKEFEDKVDDWFSIDQITTIRRLENYRFIHKWQLIEALKLYNLEWEMDQLDFIYQYFRTE